MIRHCVMLKLPRGHDRLELSEVMQGLKNVAERLPGCQGFLSGENIDLEGKSPDFPFGFTLDFENYDALSVYAQDPEHVALGQRLVMLCGSGENVLVFDLERVKI
ncbi:MAG: Dabb family protein [Sulfitobacter sp.]